MAAAKPVLQKETCATDVVAAPTKVTTLGPTGPHLVVPPPAARPGLHSLSPSAQPRKAASFQPRVPVITGEVSYRGTVSVDGVINGQLGAAASGLTIKQRPRNGGGEPELDGELSFKDLLRINGHVAGKVISQKGTLIVDTSARVEADINVGVCVVNGMVVGDIVGHERVEVNPGAVVKGNIATRALSIKPGAIFQGDCRMLKDNEAER
jgi:cytoskeletal protein CcmA (bactofilin family)